VSLPLSLLTDDDLVALAGIAERDISDLANEVVILRTAVRLAAVGMRRTKKGHGHWYLGLPESRTTLDRPVEDVYPALHSYLLALDANDTEVAP